MPGTVRVADRADTAPLAATLARAFFDDPVWEYLIPDEASRHTRLAAYFAAALTNQHLPHGACYTDTERAGGALWDPPGHWKMRLGQIVKSAPAMFGAFGRHVPRALRTLSTVERRHPSAEHWYLAILGTDPVHQGKGLGSALLRPILDRCDREGHGAYLESSKHGNIAFYHRHGFTVTGEISFPGGPTVWPMWRDPRPPGGA